MSAVVNDIQNLTKDLNKYDVAIVMGGSKDNIIGYENILLKECIQIIGKKAH